MTVKLCAIGLIAVIASCALAQDSQTSDAGRREAMRSCVPCHSIRLVESQRLSQAAWQKEVTKMIGWGAVVSDQQALLDYLAQQYPANKPMPAREMTANGSAKPGAATSSSK